MKVDDVSAERKTAENFLQLLIGTYLELEENWGVKIVAIVTDASGECRKARRDFLQKYPSVVVLDCFAHQVKFLLSILSRATNTNIYLSIRSILLWATTSKPALISFQSRIKQVILSHGCDPRRLSLRFCNRINRNQMREYLLYSGQF